MLWISCVSIVKGDMIPFDLSEALYLKKSKEKDCDEVEIWSPIDS